MRLIGFVLCSLLFCATHGSYAQLLSPEDRQIYRAAFAAQHSRNWEMARQIASAAKDRLPSKVLRWRELSQSETARLSDIENFLGANRSWPLLRNLRQHAEEVLADAADSDIRRYFDKYPPITPKGKLRLADLLVGSDRRDDVATLVREIWLKPDLGPDEEDLVLQRYANLLRIEDHVSRLDRLLWEGQLSAARRQMQRVPGEWRALAEARLALADGQDDAEAALARVPPTLRNDPGLVLEHARWCRRKGRLDDAAPILQGAPPELVRPGAWWAERDILVRKLMDEHKDRLAYALASWRSLQETGAELAEAEFISGWLALRRLNDATSAYVHFTQLYAQTQRPLSRSRGAYWAGRAAEALGQPEKAHGWFIAAAEYGATYYGQLAATRLERVAVPDFPSELHPSHDESDAFEHQELVRAARMLTEIDQPDLAKAFLLQLNATAKAPIEYQLVAVLAEALGAPDVGITAAKHAGRDGLPSLTQGFPLIPLNTKGGAERPFILAITRQESGFDKSAVSRSDARGLMQIKPSTARDMAKVVGLPFAAERLLTDANYNLTLGQAYLDKLLDSFGGSYVLAAAAYNAGPRRVKEWLDAYGDPRSAGAIDWIEAIPFQETRNYVQRVLENLQVYRLRVGDRARAFTLADDLKR
jgi:soluble lytic murein transglycosylase